VTEHEAEALQTKWRMINEATWAICVTVVVVAALVLYAHAKIQNEPLTQSGIDNSNRPWCVSRDPNRPCPVFSSSFGTTGATP
jgi:hypothetical protein